MNIIIAVMDANGAVKAQMSGGGNAALVYENTYAAGDVITLRSDKPGFVVAQLEDSIQPVFGWLCGEFRLLVPFGEKLAGYSPKSFTGGMHLLWARAAHPCEIEARRNLALNPLDNHQNNGLFPHAQANVETRGESVFAARNAIDGNVCSAGHGPWPYESWGINRQADAEIKIDFGRSVHIERLIITLRADFPHDNWWKRATIKFSDGTAFEPVFEKTGMPQNFEVDKRFISWLSMGRLIKDESDPSEFPALTQLEAWGRNEDC